MTLFASHELGCDIEGVQERMQDLVQVLPDLSKTVMQSQPPCAGQIFGITKHAWQSRQHPRTTPFIASDPTSIAKMVCWGLELCCMCVDISMPEKGLSQHICKFLVRAKL